MDWVSCIGWAVSDCTDTGLDGRLLEDVIYDILEVGQLLMGSVAVSY